jgi:putative ABC transport system ATP-binding protein
MSESIPVPATGAVEEQVAGPVVEAHDLTRRYGEGDTAVDALRGVSLEVSKGKLTAVMGPSGSGKSTLMHILAALDTPTGGYVVLAGNRLGELSDTEITKLRRKHIGFVFQFFNLLPMLTAEENVLLPMTIAGEKPERQWFEDLLKNVGLADRRTHRPAELSGGQQQRVAIARALVSKPTVVFADEPTGNLDSKTSGEILELMRNSVDSYGQTTVMVTHDPRAAGNCRPHPLPGRRSDRARHAALRGARRDRGDGRADRGLTGLGRRADGAGPAFGRYRKPSVRAATYAAAQCGGCAP